MCNLYRMTKPVEAVAGLFRAPVAGSPNFAAEVYPGSPGLVVAEGSVRAMNWGFPLAQTSKKDGTALKPKPVNNAREDKLETPFWVDSFWHRRCLIPVTAWAAAEGAAGAMTRTWYSPLEQALFAVAGIWRPTVEWGDSYSMVLVAASAATADVHDRMPAILAPEDWEQWLHGAPDDAIELCRTHGEALIVDRTDEPWFKSSTASALQSGTDNPAEEPLL